MKDTLLTLLAVLALFFLFFVGCMMLALMTHIGDILILWLRG